MDTNAPPSPKKESSRGCKAVEEDSSRIGNIWQELRRRKVMRVAITYGVVAWLLIQVAATVFPQIGMPEWGPKMVTWILLIGFPIAVIIAWAFELTPDGINTTKHAREIQGDDPVSKKVQRKRNWMALGFAAALPTVVFGALALFFYARSGGGADTGISEKSIAVLPLENMSPDPDNAFFADGVQEDILTNLSKIKDLGVVISRSSTLRYRDPDRNLKQVGQELGVRYIVEGSVRRAANQVRVTVQLIDSQTDDHIWAENYDRSLDNIFAIQAEIAKKIAEQLQAELSPEEIEKIEYRPTENQEAYDAYLQARQLIERFNTHLGDEKLELLEKAVRLDPNFDEAWALLSGETIFWWNYYHKDDESLRTRAKEALEIAEQQAPGSPHVLYAKAQFLRDAQEDLEGSIDHLLSALSVDPNNSYAHFALGGSYRSLGRLTEARHYYERMLKADPFSPRANRAVTNHYLRLELWDEAQALIDLNLERGDFSDSWLKLKAEEAFLKTGDLNTFISDKKRIPGIHEQPEEKVMIALLERDYKTALPALLALPKDSDIDHFSASRFVIGPIDLVVSLVQFESGASDWQAAADRALKVLKKREKIIPNSYRRANYYYQTAICEALSGNKEKMDTAIADLRSLTRTDPTQYRTKARGELGIAICHLILGEEDKAIETLEAASKLESEVSFNRELQIWFIFDRLKGNPRFDALLN